MKQSVIKSVFLAASACLVVGCSSSNTQSQNATIGAVTGAVVGGVAGSAIGSGAGTAVAVGAGIVGGALIGGAMGSSMDHSDYRQTNYALSHSPYKKAHHWKGKNGTHYTVVPTSKSKRMYGYSQCRNYTMTASMHGKKEKVHGVACRKPNGSWVNIK
jgi:surface antigen